MRGEPDQARLGGVLTTALEVVTAPLDQGRRVALRWLLATPVLGRLVRDRDRRVGLHAFVGVGAALTLTALWPAALFVVGPLLLGVAHVVGDLRYLVLRRSVSSSVVVLGAVFAAGLFAARVTDMLMPGAGLTAAQELRAIELWAGASVVAAVLSQHGQRARGLIAGGLVLGLGAAAQARPDLAQMAFAHLHNVIGIALWLWLFRRRVAPVVPALALLVAGLVLVGSGVTLGQAESRGALTFGGQHLSSVAEWVAPGLPARWMLGALMTYILLQAVHYSVWIAWVPQEDTRAEGTMSFRMSARSLRDDLRWLTVPVVLVAVAVPLIALRHGAVLTRDGYLSLASFHGYLEVAMAAYFFVAPAALERSR